MLNATNERLLAAAGLIAIAGSTNAQITFDGFQSWEPTSSFHGANFDASASDKLVIVITGEHNFPDDLGGAINSITYDGVSLTRAVDVNPADPGTGGHGQTVHDIWYLDDPFAVHTTGLLGASVGGSGNNYTYTAILLSGTADGVGATATNPGSNSVDLTTTAANSWVISSIGMGGQGNTANITNVNPSSPIGAIKIDALEAGSNWAGHVAARSVIATAGLNTFSFSTGNTDVATVAVEILEGPPPPLLTMEVDTITGAMTLLGNATDAITINYYEVTSAGNSLDASGWNSLADQDFEGNGPPTGTGDGWEEGGGSGTHALAEAFLLGDSEITAGAQISLGTGYNPAIDAQDLVFQYRANNGKIFNGLISYVQNPIPGDFDGDGDVDGVDVATMFSNFNGPGGGVPTNPLTDLDNDGDCDGVDVANLFSLFTGPLTPANVPEPASLALLGLGALALNRRIR